MSGGRGLHGGALARIGVVPSAGSGGDSGSFENGKSFGKGKRHSGCRRWRAAVPRVPVRNVRFAPASGVRRGAGPGCGRCAMKGIMRLPGAMRGLSSA